jgi:hypothetical protein
MEMDIKNFPMTFILSSKSEVRLLVKNDARDLKDA